MPGGTFAGGRPEKASHMPGGKKQGTALFGSRQSQDDMSRVNSVWFEKYDALAGHPPHLPDRAGGVVEVVEELPAGGHVKAFVGKGKLAAGALDSVADRVGSSADFPEVLREVLKASTRPLHS